MKKKKTSSILRKFLLFNLSIFSVLGLFTILYLNAIQPNLVKKVSANHFIIIKNTSDHIERLEVEFDKEGIKKFDPPLAFFSRLMSLEKTPQFVFVWT